MQQENQLRLASPVDPRSVLTEQPDLEGEAWWDWPAAFRDRDPDTMAK